MAVASQSAQGATLYLRWTDATGSTRDFFPGDQADVEIWVDLLSGDSVSAVAFTNTAVSELSQLSTVVHPSGWSNSSINGPFDGISQYLGFSAAVQSELVGPGSFKIATQTVLLDAGTTSQTLEISVDHSTVLFFNVSGIDFTWNALYNTLYPGIVAYGDFGNPGWGIDPALGHQPTSNPLIVNRLDPAYAPMGQISLFRSGTSDRAATVSGSQMRSIVLDVKLENLVAQGASTPYTNLSLYLETSPYAGTGLPGADSYAFRIEDRTLLGTNVTVPTRTLVDITSTSNGFAFLNPTNDADLGASNISTCGFSLCADGNGVYGTLVLQ